MKILHVHPRSIGAITYLSICRLPFYSPVTGQRKASPACTFRSPLIVSRAAVRRWCRCTCRGRGIFQLRHHGHLECVTRAAVHPGQGDGQFCAQLVLDEITPLSGVRGCSGVATAATAATATAATTAAAATLATPCAAPLLAGGAGASTWGTSLQRTDSVTYWLLPEIPAFGAISRGNSKPGAVVDLTIDAWGVTLADDGHPVEARAGAAAHIERIDIDNGNASSLFTALRRCGRGQCTRTDKEFQHLGECGGLPHSSS